MSLSEQFVYTIVPIYNQYHETRQAVASLLASTYPNHQICIVDNGSTDGSLDLLSNEFPMLDFLQMPENLGFAAAVNIGLGMALRKGASYAFVCNNDVIVSPAMLGELVHQMDEQVGAVSPTIYYMDSPQKVWSAGYYRDPILLELRSLTSRSAGALSSSSFQIDYIFGCGMLINLKVIDAIGGFDERYFFYYEDMDFCIRLAQAKYSILTVPSAEMWHKVSLTAGNDSAFGTFHKARGSVIFFTTHLTLGTQIPYECPSSSTSTRHLLLQLLGLDTIRTMSILGFRLASTLKKSLRFLYNRRFDLLSAHWRGLEAGWRSRKLSPQVDIRTRLL